MSKNEIEDILKKMGCEEVPADVQRIAEETSNNFNKTLMPSRQQILWRTIMKSKLNKLAAAAVIIVAIALSISYFGGLTSSAYAIGQTIEAISGIKFIHAIMKDDSGRIVDERWIELGRDGFQSRYRQESNFLGQSLLIVDDGKTCFFHDRNKNTVVLYDPEEQQYQWIYNLGQFFKDMAGDSTVTIEQNVEYKGQNAHRVRWLKLNQDCYIDPETKLPIAVGPHDVYYEEPPAEMFTYAIPEGAVVVDKQSGAPEEPQPEWMNQDENANEHFNHAKQALANGKYIEATALFGKVVKVQAGRNWAWFRLGRAHYELEQYDAAITTFSQVIEMFAQFKTVPHYCHLARGLAYRATGIEEAAQKDFEVALPVMIDALRNPKGANLFDYADEALNKGRDLSEKQRIDRMIIRLRQVTGQNFGYDPDASVPEKERAISAWEKWFEDSRQIEVAPGSN